MCASPFAPKLLLLALGLVFAMAPKSALAQTEAPPVITAEPVVLTATRQETKAFDLPQTSATIEAERLRNSRMLQDALREVAGVQIQRTSQGQVSPYMRGLTGYHTLLLLDGVRLNNSILRAGPNEYWGLVDGQSLSRAELLTGPASSLYGSDAVGGTLNAFSRRREDYSEEFGFNAMTRLRAASAEQSWIVRSELQGNIGTDLGFLIGGTYADYGDLERGGNIGVQPNTGYDSYHADAAIDWFLDENWSMNLTVRTSAMEEVPRTHTTTAAIPYRGTSVGTNQKRDLTFERDIVILGLRGQDLDGFFQEMDLKLSYVRLEEGEDRIRGNGVRNLQGFEVDTLGIALQLTTEFDVGRLTYGFDWYHDEVSSFLTNFNAAGAITSRGVQGAVADDSSYDLVGLFAQYELPLGEEFEIFAAGRFTYAQVDAGRVRDPLSGNATSFDDEWFDASFSLRAVWKPDDAFRVFGGVAQAFRAPNLSDLTRFDIARSGELEIASLGLDPERFITFEIGGRFDYEGLRVEAMYYYSLIDDFIIRQPTGNIVGTDIEVAKRNAAEGNVQGIEFTTSYRWDESWSLFGTFSWTDGQIDSFPTSSPVSRKEPLTRLQPMRGIVGARYDSPAKDFYARSWIEGSFGQDRLSTSDRRDTERMPPNGTPSWMTVNVEGGVKINDHAEAFVAVENIGDVDYRRHGSGLNEPGVNFIMGLELRF